MTLDELKGFLPLKAEEVEWVVNSLGELGVKIGSQFFWLYKGDSLIYDDPTHERDGSPMLWRKVGKREFGETCWPLKWIMNNRREDRYAEELMHTPGLSLGTPDDCQWKPIPAPGQS